MNIISIYSLNHHSGLEIKRGAKLLDLMEVTFLVEDKRFWYQVIYEHELVFES